MFFVITAMDKENALALRKETRAAHVDYVRKTGAAKLEGPFLDSIGDMCGSLIIIEAADIEAARNWQTNDPFALAGLFARVDIHPWKPAANHPPVTFGDARPPAQGGGARPS
jgi:hypothetical protein